MDVSDREHSVSMQKAIALARENPRAPFGTVLVDRRTHERVASGINQSHENPTQHGEIVAINDYVAQGGTDWDQLILYTTAEPCCMCQGAILWSGIRHIVFGTSISRLMELGWRQIDISAQEVIARSWATEAVVVGGVHRVECDQLFEAAKKVD